MAQEGSLNFTNEIRVLVIQHDFDNLLHTIELLQVCSYKVVAVQKESAALWTLSQRKHELDFVLADIRVPGLDPFTLLHITSELGVRTILMCPEKDPIMVRRGLENGAYMVLEKPFTLETMKYLWQHAMREKISSYKSGRPEGSDTSDESCDSAESKGKSPLIDTQNETHKGRKNRRKKGKMPCQSENKSIRVRRMVYAEWTAELHQKFLDAVHQLGEGRCYPRDILDLMNVPGLTRMQVASHLQKCRSRLWQPNSNLNARSKSPRKFGCMPMRPKECENPQPETSKRKIDEPPLGPPPGFPDRTLTNPMQPETSKRKIDEPPLGPPPGFPERTLTNPMQPETSKRKIDEPPLGPPPGFPERPPTNLMLPEMIKQKMEELPLGPPPGFPERAQAQTIPMLPETIKQKIDEPPLGPPPGFPERAPTKPMQPETRKQKMEELPLGPPPGFPERAPTNPVPPDLNVVNQNEIPDLNVQLGYVPILSPIRASSSSTRRQQQQQNNNYFPEDDDDDDVIFLYDRPGPGSSSSRKSRTQRR